MRIAILADIHSNLPALEAVQADLHAMAPDMVFLAGDLVNRCPWPNEVMQVAHDEGWPAISGNHELLVVHLGTAEHKAVFDDRRRFADLWWTLAHLQPEHLAEIRQMPEERRIVVGDAQPILLVHGIRHDPFVGIYPTMSDEQIAGRLSDVSEPVVVTAHTHWPLDRTIGAQRVLNPGSVGMPYNGDPRAQYLLLDLVGTRWQPTFRQVEYDRSYVREAFDRYGLFHEYGPMGPLYWQTIATGDPWVSDFQVWVRDQAPIVREDLDHAVELYLAAHGPGKWAFSPL